MLRLRSLPGKSTFSALLALALVGCLRCDRSVPDEPTTERRVIVIGAAGASARSTPDPAVTKDAESVAGKSGVELPKPPHPGPWFTVLQPSIAIYSEPAADRANKLGYAQSGAKLAVTGQPKPGDKCSSGWIDVVPTGHVCAGTGTLDEKDGRIKFTIKQPALDSILPYTYARNAKNGTPLYRSIPTRKQMIEYEPYLRKEDKPPEGDANLNTAGAGPVARPANSVAIGTIGAPAAPASSGPLAPPASSVLDDRPWWQQDDIEDRLHELRLTDLQKDSDDILALRMVKGFYVAVDRIFHWSGRTWYKTTKGLVAPADRMGQAAPSDFKGVELGADWHLPVGWVHGGREKATTFELDLEKKRTRQAGNVARFQPIQFTERVAEIDGVSYREMADGKWIRREHVRVTEPGVPPKELSVNERWVDINLASQTLVVFEGTTPIYATLASTGKKSKIKEKDHSTPIGTWRIREKHVTTTMDGDGSAAGDLPYSIEDVPYVMYFHKSYAVHAAFWHRNYGVQMSHGCINLAPLDAKAVFNRTEPALPEGWHGAWSTRTTPGSWVSVHD